MKTDDSVTRREARALDRALAGEKAHRDPDGLLATAAELRAMFDFEVPNANRERAMFVSGVGTRHHAFNPLRLVVPVAAFFLLIALVYMAGRTALPGDSLYPVRKALGSVGLAESPAEEIDSRLGEAGSLISRAERIIETNPGTSLRLAVDALEELGPAIDLLDELKGEDLAAREDAIEGLESRAVDVITEVAQTGLGGGGNDNDDEGSGSAGASDDDRSGSNSGTSSGDDDGDDNSGPSSDDDNSGPGSGDDGDDDRSGSNSGPGGGDDGDDRSGSNSGSGSGGDDGDNSGPGGGGDDDDELPDVDEGRNGGGSDNSGPGGGGGGDDDDDDERDDVDLDDLEDDERDDDDELLS